MYDPDGDVKRVIERSITVDDLIDALENYRGMRIVATTNYGDRGRTEQVHPISENDLENIDNDQKFDTTGYSYSGVCLRSVDDPTDEGPRDVVILRL